MCQGLLVFVQARAFGIRVFLVGLLMGNTVHTASEPCSKITLGAYPTGKSYTDIEDEEYWGITDLDRHRFFRIAYLAQPELKKGFQIVWDAEVFPHQGECYYVLPGFY